MTTKKTLILRQMYQGRPSNEAQIAPGTYVVDDPRLFGVGDYLIKNGFAQEGRSVTAPDAPQAEEETLDAPSDATMALAEQIAARLVTAAQASQNATPETSADKETETPVEQQSTETPVEQPPAQPAKPATNPNAAKKKASQ